MGIRKDLSGQRFGRLVALSPTNETKRAGWLCKCDCGRYTKVVTGQLTSGQTKSCGCYAIECKQKYQRTHGQSQTRLYAVYDDMKARCYRKKSTSYPLYGNKGIVICDEWLGKDGFENFSKWASENGYNPKAKRGECTLDRIDTKGNYEPANCRWVTAQIQARNTQNNHFVTYNGKTKCIAEWAEIYGIKQATFAWRINQGMPFEMAISKHNLNKGKKKGTKAWQTI